MFHLETAAIGAQSADPFDATGIRTNGRLTYDLNLSDVAESIDVGSPAELQAVPSGAHDPHAVAVLVAKERNGAHRLGLGLGRLDRIDVLVQDHVRVRERENLARLFA